MSFDKAIDNLQKRVAELNDQLEYSNFKLAETTDHFEKQSKEVCDLKAALEFYADPEHWTIDWVEGPYGDYGARARKALGR